MRWAPQSLFGRLLTALLTVMGITLSVIVLMTMQDRRELALRVGGAWSTSHRIAELTESLAKLSGEQRRQEIARLKAKPVAVGPIDFKQDVKVLRRRPDTVNIAERFASQLKKQLGDGYRVSVIPARPETVNAIRIVNGVVRTPDPPLTGPLPPQVFIGDPRTPNATYSVAAEHGTLSTGAPPPPNVRGRVLLEANDDGPSVAGAVAMTGPGRPTFIFRGSPPPGAAMLPLLFDVNVALPDGETLTFRVAPPWPEPPLPVRFFLELGILTLVLGLALYVTTRSITQPLSDLAQAADAVGRSVRHPQLIEKGAREIRDATRAFNSMQDRLLRYLDSRTRVLAAMSHDLKTPLTRLRLRVESISDPRLRERFGIDLDEMESLVRGALGLFKGLDDDEVFSAVDVDELLRTLQSQFEELGGTVTIEGRARGPISAKPRALKRCLANLIENAIKFGSKATLVVEDGQALVIRARDDGPGIPPDALEQVFEPFFRLESSRSRDTGGTGLGLTIARDVAQAHGGTLILTNLPERGLEAVLTLPRNSFRR